MPIFRLERLTHAAVAVLRAVATVAGRRSAPVLVGGAVRDAWLERRPGRGAVDLDVAVPAGALDLARRVAERLGGAFVALDAERGTGRVVVPGLRLDVTDFRGPTLAADLAARDFTVDALAVPLRELLAGGRAAIVGPTGDRQSPRLNSRHSQISYAVFCLQTKRTLPRTRLAHSFPRLLPRCTGFAVQ